MKFNSFEWDENNYYHAIRHGISKEEIEEAIVTAALIRKGKSGIYIAYGQTFDGRYVLVLFQYKGQRVARPFSARPMTHNEKKRYKETVAY